MTASPAPPSGPAGPAALELRDVRAAYDRIEVLRGVSLRVEPGRILALLGPNGAGKTTTIRVAGGRLRPTGGQVLVAGTPVRRPVPERLARRGLCSIPEGRGVFPNLTVAENLRMWTYRGVSRREVEEAAYNRFPRLAERRRQLAGSLSGGEQQMLAMSRALSTDPGILLLDEISMGLAPLVVAELYELVLGIAAGGCAVLLVEQFATAALAVADRAAVMAGGRVELEGRPDEVREALGGIYLRSAPGHPVVMSESRTP